MLDLATQRGLSDRRDLTDPGERRDLKDLRDLRHLRDLCAPRDDGTRPRNVRPVILRPIVAARQQLAPCLQYLLTMSNVRLQLEIVLRR